MLYVTLSVTMMRNQPSLLYFLLLKEPKLLFLLLGVESLKNLNLSPYNKRTKLQFG